MNCEKAYEILRLRSALENACVAFETKSLRIPSRAVKTIIKMHVIQKGCRAEYTKQLYFN
jgi:hypothetical protein